MKTCFKCGRRLTLDQFYKHPMMADGRLGKCKDCTKRDVRENYAARRDQYLEYEHKRSRTLKRKQGIRRSQKKYPERHRARVTLHNAVNRGKITKQPCEVCGETQVDAHHDDYARPLDVRWLCRRHHAKRHREMREAEVARERKSA